MQSFVLMDQDLSIQFPSNPTIVVVKLVIIKRFIQVRKKPWQFLLEDNQGEYLMEIRHIIDRSQHDSQTGRYQTLHQDSVSSVS